MLHRTPWLCTDTHCHQMITPHQPKGPGGWSEAALKLRCLTQPMPAKTAKSTPVGHQETDVGKMEIAPGTPVIGRGPT